MPASHYFTAAVAVVVACNSQLSVGDEASICPVPEQLDHDPVHIAFVIPSTRHAELRRFVVEILHASPQEELSSIHTSRSISYSIEERSVFWRETGSQLTVEQQLEIEKEYVVVRSFDDCILEAGVFKQLYPYRDSTYLLTRAFAEQVFNIAIVDALAQMAKYIVPVSELGRSWLCAVVPTHVDCLE